MQFPTGVSLALATALVEQLLSAAMPRYTGAKPTLVVSNPMLEPDDEAADGDGEAHADVFHSIHAIGRGAEGFFRAAEDAGKLGEEEITALAKSDPFRYAKLAASIVAPAMDTWSDAWVAYTWWESGQLEWFAIAIAITLLSAVLSGGAFWRITVSKLGGGRWYTVPALSQEPGDLLKGFKEIAAKLGCCLLGLLGLVPTAQACMVLFWDASGNLAARIHAEQKIAIIEGLELVVETLGQTTLQLYIGIAYGELDPADPRFSKALAFSVAIGMLEAGNTSFQFECCHREDLSVLSMYGVVTTLWRCCQTAALVCSLALCSCAFKGSALFPAALSLILTAYSGAATINVPAYHMWPLSGQVTGKQNLALGLLSFGNTLGLLLLFWYQPHDANNYADTSLAPTTNATLPQVSDA